MYEEERIRHARYCQLRREIRVSGEHLIVGIDIAKDKHHAFFGTATGKVLLKRLVFHNTKDGIRKLLGQVEALKVCHNLPEVVFGFEPTGNYHKPLGDHLVRCGHMVVLVSGAAVKKNREIMDGRWDKNDTRDAANIADLISQGKCLFYEYPPQEIRNLRDLLSLRRRFKKEEHRLRLRIRNNLVTKHFPEFDRFFSENESESLSIVKWCLDPRKIHAMDFDQFFIMVTSKRRSLAQERRLRAIHWTANDSIGCPVGAADDFESGILVDQVKGVQAVIKEIESHIEEICLGFAEYGYLLSIPGFGPYVSSVVLASIGNPWRFHNAGQIIRLAGYDLSANRSGKTSDKAIPEISKKGNADLRYALYQAALIGSTRNKDVMDYFTRKLKDRSREKGIGAKMRVKLSVKLLVIAWTLMKKKEPFNPEYLKGPCLEKQGGVSHLLEEKRARAMVRSRASASSSRRDRRPLNANRSVG
ncbi:MAG TPA: IS110 family transposase [Deltaproteobacteria bacterium]|nr:IS110 family transposase [Deltaproteobacteria bacterium]